MHKNTKELSCQRFFDGDCSLNRGLPIDLFCHVQKNHTTNKELLNGYLIRPAMQVLVRRNKPQRGGHETDEAQ